MTSAFGRDPGLRLSYATFLAFATFFFLTTFPVSAWSPHRCTQVGEVSVLSSSKNRYTFDCHSFVPLDGGLATSEMSRGILFVGVWGDLRVEVGCKFTFSNTETGESGHDPALRHPVVIFTASKCFFFCRIYLSLCWSFYSRDRRQRLSQPQALLKEAQRHRHQAAAGHATSAAVVFSSWRLLSDFSGLDQLT